ncbi:MAG TPA: hypothetical protein PLO61_00625 [Fimbriimonadaceae bacterium]|nr:hypothetical protein [Fimbriimonadaceae bacterium]HRJ32402.1 hypothetical protein [Fimbriimonadaceae bacterium]
MKLNLLPPYVSKAGQSKRAWLVSILLIGGSLAAAAFMIIKSKGDLDLATKEASEARPAYDATVAKAQEADTVIAQGTGYASNVRLAEAMKRQHTVYLDLYRDVLGYMPAFFRVRSIQASPSGEGNALVRIQGVLYSHQQYADMMLALLRIPGAAQISREGFNLNDPAVPRLTFDDQIGIPRASGEVPLPSDPLERFEVMLATGSEPTDFAGVGGYGLPEGVRGPMPGGSSVTFTVTLVGRNLQTPNPRESIRKTGGAGAAPAPAGGNTPPPPNPGPTNEGEDD